MSPAHFALRKILTGGQTGVDLGALKAAAAAGLQTGGWCPPDQCNETGPIAGRYGLVPAPQERSRGAARVPRSLRTEWNVRDADATLVLQPAQSEITDAGTQWTIACAARYDRPLLCLDPSAPDAGETIRDWLGAQSIGTLNVAGPAESAAPGIEARTAALLADVFRRAAAAG